MLFKDMTGILDGIGNYSLTVENKLQVKLKYTLITEGRISDPYYLEAGESHEQGIDPAHYGCIIFNKDYLELRNAYEVIVLPKWSGWQGRRRFQLLFTTAREICIDASLSEIMCVHHPDWMITQQRARLDDIWNGKEKENKSKPKPKKKKGE